MMRKPRTALALFCLVAAAQLAVPGWLIAEREWVLRTGETFRFRTAPVDPYDAFRGRYVALGFEAAEVAVDPAAAYRRGQTVYARLGTGSDEFAVVARVSLDRPQTGTYVRAKIQRVSRGRVRLRLPFDRYYMDENLAPEAESVYRRRTRREQRDAYALVRVRRGIGVIEELYVGGRPIRDVLGEE
jgi:uncharacterized membrane-anchored protein